MTVRSPGIPPVIPLAAGSASAPSLTPQGDSNTGTFFPAADTIALATGGTEACRVDSSQRLLRGTPSYITTTFGNSGIQNVGVDAKANMFLLRFQAANAPAALGLGMSRSGVVGTHTVVQSGDSLGNIYFAGSDGTSFINAALISGECDATPGTNDMPGRLVFWTVTDGGTTMTERLRIDNTGALIHRANATTIVDASSHLGLRTYTVATLPSASTAARLIYVSDGTSNKRLAVSDGTNWRFPDGAVVS